MKLSELIETIGRELTETKEWEDPNFLANLLPRLASYYATLGPMLADTERDSDLAEAQYKLVRETAIADTKAAGDTDKESAAKAVITAHGDYLEHIARKHKARLIFLTRQSISLTIDSVRSKLSYLKTEKESSQI